MKESAKAEMQSLKLSLLKKSWTTCVSVQFMFFLKKCMKEIDQIHLSSEAQCVSHHLPPVDCHMKPPTFLVIHVPYSMQQIPHRFKTMSNLKCSIYFTPSHIL